MKKEDLYQGDILPQIIVDAIGRFRNRPALAWRDEILTYARMGDEISRIIQAFKSLGLKRGQGIAQLAGNRPETICVTLAANVMGLRYTPLHPLGSLDDQVFILNDAEVSAVVVDPEKFGERVNQFRENVPGLAHVVTMGPGGVDLLALAREFEPRDLEVEAEPHDIAWLAYTGGTTGKPKGVMLPLRSVTANLMMVLSGWELPDLPRFLAVTPVSHASGLMAPPVFVRGGMFILGEAFSPHAFLGDLKRHQANATFLVPTMIYALLDHKGFSSHAVSGLETVIYGAAAISPSRLREAIEAFGPVFMQLYGQTESPNTICTLRRADHDPGCLDRLSSCGRPMVGIQVALLDEACREVPKGETGEICVRGPLVMDGYWKREEETAAALDGDWLHTGDMAREDDEGFYYIVDRKKDMIISGGFNVFPREVEDVLSSHDKVSAVSVFGVPDPKWGEKVVAAVVCRPGDDLSADELIALVKEKKGAVHAPKEVHFMDELPVTALGKPDKKALRAMFGS